MRNVILKHVLDLVFRVTLCLFFLEFLFAYLGFFGALKHATATAVSASLFLVPVVAVVVEAIYGNAPSASVLVGMALAIVGVGAVMFAPEFEARWRLARGPGSVAEKGADR